MVQSQVTTMLIRCLPFAGAITTPKGGKLHCMLREYIQLDRRLDQEQRAVVRSFYTAPTPTPDNAPRHIWNERACSRIAPPGQTGTSTCRRSRAGSQSNPLLGASTEAGAASLNRPAVYQALAPRSNSRPGLRKNQGPQPRPARIPRGLSSQRPRTRAGSFRPQLWPVFRPQTPPVPVRSKKWPGFRPQTPPVPVRSKKWPVFRPQTPPVPVRSKKWPVFRPQTQAYPFGRGSYRSAAGS
jgi:hypothetical protein